VQMKSYITVLVAVLFVSWFGLPCFAACSSADLTGDHAVNLEDFAIMSAQWLTTDPCGCDFSGGSVGYLVVAINTPSDIKAKADYKCDGTNDEVEIQAAIDKAAVSGGTVYLAAGTYTLSASVMLKSGVWLKGATATMSPKGIADLTGTVSGGTIITGSGITAFTGNNIYGGGIEDICISGINGMSLGKQNQFGPQFWAINRVYVFNPPDFGVRLYNFGQVQSDQIAVFSKNPSPIPTTWTGVDLVSENDAGSAATLNYTTDIFTVTDLSYSNGDTVFFQSGTLPTVGDGGAAISTETPYYIIGVSGQTFQIARTLGGTAINFSNTGANLVIGGCNFQPGNSVFRGTYVLWTTASDLSARSLRGIQCRVVSPVYHSQTHTGLQLNFLTYIRPQVNMMNFDGTLAGCDRIPFHSKGLSGVVCNGFNMVGGDFEGRNQNALRLEHVTNSMFDVAGLSSYDHFDSGLYMANCTLTTIRGNAELTLELDSSSADQCVGIGMFYGLKSGAANWLKGTYLDASTLKMHYQLSGYSSSNMSVEASGGRILMTRNFFLPTIETLGEGQSLGLERSNFISFNNTASGGTSIALPSPTGFEGYQLTIQKGSNNAYVLTITGAVGGNVAMNAQYQTVGFFCTGQAWVKMWQSF